MNSSLLRRIARCVLVVPIIMLAACSGGGGASASDPAPVSPLPPSPPAPVVTTGPFASEQATSRFLTQATFGSSSQTVSQTLGTDVSDWLVAEFNKPASLNVPALQAFIARVPEDGDHNELVGNATTHSFWRHAISGDDQLRQRMAFALSQILVVSTFGGELLSDVPEPVAYYMDILNRNAFGNYRDLLEAVTYAPAMGHYLTYIGNEKADPVTGRMPDENYAREILQLFTIGLVELNPDGTPVLGMDGQPVELFTNADITGLARVFTGLDFSSDERLEALGVESEFLVPMSIRAETHSS